MVRLTAADERLAHQIPEALPAVAVHHDFWRESYFFVMHPRSGTDGDVVIATMASYPASERLDSYQMGRIGGQFRFALHERPYGDDPHTTVVGPLSVEIVEPYRTVRITATGEAAAPALDLTFTARTAAYGMRRGTMKAGHEIIWDQSQMIQSGTFDGWYEADGTRREVEAWWGQRDHSWGIRNHARCPMWLWLALQLEDGMIGCWHWELANGAHVFTDGCFAPADGSEPIPVTAVRHAFTWTGEDGEPVGYGEQGAQVRGLTGGAELDLGDGSTIRLSVDGRWAMPYGPMGGGQHLVEVTLDDGRRGNGVVEITGAGHHRYFPVHRSDRLPG